jgi:hypothetical protein
MRTLLRPALLATAAVFLLTSCTLVGRWGYETLPTWMMWRIQSYLDLEGEQKALARRHIDALHQWHQSTQLTPLAAQLKQWRTRVQDGQVDAAALQSLRDAMALGLEPLLDQAAPRIAEVAQTLEPAQIARMRREFAQDNEKMRRERLQGSPAERAEARSKRYIERAEFFLGDLSAAQRQTIRVRSAQWPPVEQQWFEQRLSRQQELLALLERLRSERLPAATGQRLMREHLQRYLQWRDGAEREGGLAAMAAGDTLLIEILAGMSPRQRQHLLDRLDDWIETLERLATRR